MAYYHDGQVLNLAGGFTGARTSILQSQTYYDELQNETWRGRYKITTGEDNTCTRFIVQHGWRTDFINADDAKMLSCASTDARYLKEVKRWSRDTARSYLKDFRFAIKSGKRRAYVCALLNVSANYASDAAVIMELVFIIVSFIASAVNDKNGASTLERLLAHFTVSSALTVLEHFVWFRTPTRLIHIPGSIIYMYLHAMIVLYSCFTLNMVS